MKLLTENEIGKRLEELEGWEYVDNALYATFEFENFKEAFVAMTRIAFEAEKMNHHPEWTNSYNLVEFYLSTHDANGVTEKDFELAMIIEDLIG